MVTRDVLKLLTLHSPTAHAILRTFKTSLVPINHEMHSCSYDFLLLIPIRTLEQFLLESLYLHLLIVYSYAA